MKIKCEVIQDLLPLYVDDVLSDESRKLVEEHLAECDECRKYCDDLKSAEDVSVDQDFAGEMEPLKRIRRGEIINRIAVIAILIAFVALTIGILSKIDLTYSWKVEDHVSYTVPEGYELRSDESSKEYLVYVRETDETWEKLSIILDDRRNLDFYEEEKVDVGNDWEGWISKTYDQEDHSDLNRMIGLLYNDEDALEIEYTCRIWDKGAYYDSCSPEQQKELIAFMNTFEHKDQPAEGNVFQRLQNNVGPGGLIMFGVMALILVLVPIAIMISSLTGKGAGRKDRERPVSSMDLHREMNEERKAKGDSSISAINTIGGVSTNNLARKDKSWSSVPDFFIKLFRGRSDK